MPAGADLEAHAAAATARLRRLEKLPLHPSEEESDDDEGPGGWAVLSPDRRPTSRWAPDESAQACVGCGVPFSVLVRRHHCRRCGDVFCAACTAFRTKGEDTGRQHRVCTACSGTSSTVGNASSVADATNDFTSAVADTAQFAAGSLVPRFGAAITAPIQGAVVGFESGGGRGAAEGFVEGFGRGGGGLLKGTIRTVGLAAKGAVAAGRLGYHGASAIGSSFLHAAEDAQLGEAASELVAAPLRRQVAVEGGGARGFVTGVAEGVGGLAASAATTVGLTTKDLGEKTLAVTHRLINTEDGADNPQRSSDATASSSSPVRSERFRPAFTVEEGAGLKVVAIYENQRRPIVLGGEFGPQHLFRFERGPESDADGEPANRNDPALLGDGWRWAGSWYVVWDEYKTDDSGWCYNFNWPEPGEDRTSVLFQGWSAEPSDRFGAQTWVRRRRWERIAAPVTKISHPQQLSSVMLGSGDLKTMSSEIAPCGAEPVQTPQTSPHRQNAAYVRTQLTPREKARREKAEAEAYAEETDLHKSMNEIDSVIRDMQDLRSSCGDYDGDGVSTVRQQPEPEPELEPHPEQHWAAAGIESSGKVIAGGIMRGALSVGAAARYGQEMLIEKTDRRDTGPVSKDAKEIVHLAADVSEDVLEASRVVSSGVYTVFKTLGKSAVAGAETISTAVMGETAELDEASEKDAGSQAHRSNIDLAVEIGTAGVETAIDIYHTFRRGVSLATEEIVGATAGAVEHRHGADAGETARAVGNTVQNLGTAAFHAVSIHSVGVLDLAAETAAHLVGKDTWLEGDILYEGKLARESPFAQGVLASRAFSSGAAARSSSRGKRPAAGEEEPIGWWELRKNSLAVRVASRAARDGAATTSEFDPPTDADKKCQLAQYELFVPLAEVREIFFLTAGGSRVTPSALLETDELSSVLPGDSHTAAESEASSVGAGRHAWQRQLQIVITTVDDVRLCLRAETLFKTKAWGMELQLAVENNEERKRATWAVDMKHCCRPGARWMRDNEVSSCLDCGASFTQWKRRHHCRNCGRIFCDECSAWEHTVPGCGEARVRVCAGCLAQLEGAQAATTSADPDAAVVIASEA